MSNHLDLDQDGHSVCTDLGVNCSRKRVIYEITSLDCFVV